MGDRRSQVRHTPERRHNARGRITVVGYALGLSAVVIVLSLVWYLVDA